MNQPLGRMVGNAVEVDESVAMLEGSGPPDLVEVTLALGVELLLAGKVADSREGAEEQLRRTIDSGAAREQFARMVAAQGGDVEAPRRIAPAQPVTSSGAGYVSAIDAERLGQAIIAMRGGRQQKDDQLDHSTGFEMHVRLGDPVDAGQPLATLFANDDVAKEAADMLAGAIELDDVSPEVGPLILERVQ